MEAIRSRSTRSRRRLSPAALALAIVVGLGGGALGVATAGIVYKWSDAQGNIHYSDLPPPPDGTLISVDNRSEHERATAPPVQPVAATTGKIGPSDPADLKKSVDADVANAHADDCKQAQDRYQTYVRSRRLYKEGPNKERVYLTDAELETERVNAKREVDEVCANSQQR